jgi:hypothetical protein
MELRSPSWDATGRRPSEWAIASMKAIADSVTTPPAPPAPLGTIVTQHPVIDAVLATWHDALGKDASGYRGHVYRVFNLTRALAGTAADDEAIAVAAALHDLGIWSDGTFDYLAPSARRATEHLAAAHLHADPDEVARMIALHHQITRCATTAGPLAEAFRRADLVDVSLGIVRFGLPRAFVRDTRAAFPNAGFHRCLLRIATAWMVQHPTRPLPMMRW